MKNKSTAGYSEKTKSLFIGIIYGAIVSIFPLLLVHHEHLQKLLTVLNWPTELFIVLCLVMGAVISMHNRKLSNNGQRRSVKIMSALTISYLFCYTTCAVLCQQLDLTTIKLAENIDMISNLCLLLYPVVIKAIGLVFVFTAAVVKIMTIVHEKALRSSVLPASAWGWLLFMTGVPLIFDVWLPLLAIPGIFVFLKWIANSDIIKENIA